MKETKFRCWNKDINSWETGFAIDPNTGKAWRLEFGEMIEEIKNGVIVEYTGLKDKNGKEIYEGDIVIGEIHENRKFKGAVEWHNKYFGFILHDVYQIETTGYYLGIIGEPEVIGNVYQNPELLLAQEKRHCDSYGIKYFAFDIMNPK